MLGLNFRDHAHRQTRGGSPMRKSSASLRCGCLSSAMSMWPNQVSDEIMLFLTSVASSWRGCLRAGSPSALFMPATALWQSGENPIGNGTFQ